MSNAFDRQLGDVEIPDPVSEWRATRISWSTMTLMVGLAGLGLFGDGWLSRRTVTLSPALRVTLDRVMRVGNTSQLTITSAGRTAAPPTRIRLVPLRAGWRHIGVRVSPTMVRELHVLVLP
jgi:hypothetical protein